MVLHQRRCMHARRRGRAPGFRTGSAAPKEQPPRKLSGKRTAGGRALWKAAGDLPLTEGVSLPPPYPPPLAGEGRVGAGESLRVHDRGGSDRTPPASALSEVPW